MSDQPRRIAIVDDDDAICRALKRLIVASGMDATIFRSGQAFLESMSTEQPDCVLLDLHMSGVTGADVLLALAKHNRAIPIIVITGRDDTGNKASVLALGARAYLSKPLDPSELRSAIDEALASA
jgi:FixJ family two-component response regulator